MLAEGEDIEAVRDFFPDIVIGIERIAALIDIAELHRFADRDIAIVGLFLAGDQFEQCRLARAVRPDHADDAAGWQAEGQVLEQQLVAIGLGQALGLDHLAAKPLGRLDQDLRLAGRAVFLGFDQLVERLDPRLGFGLARLGALADPFQLVGDGLLLALVLALFLFEPLRLLIEIGRIITFVDKVAAAIELEDPVDDIVEEIAVMGDEDDVARIVDQMLFEPGDAFGVQMVRRLVEQQDIGLVEQQTAQCHAAALAAREILDVGIARRATQCVHRDFELIVERPTIDRVDLLLELAHLFHELIEIRVLGRIGHHPGNLIESIDQIGDRPHAVHHILFYRLVRIELGFLREIAHTDPLAWPRLAAEIGVDTGHDLHQRRFARTVRPDDADLGVWIELQMHLIEDRLAGAGKALGHAFHDEGILRGHGSFTLRIGITGIGPRCRGAEANWQTLKRGLSGDMKKILLPLALCATALPSYSFAQPSDADIAAMRDTALEGDTLAFAITEGLSTEIGPRLAGTEAEARARDWAMARLTALGFSNVRTEPFQLPTWVRGTETAEIVSPYPQQMHVAALGRSGSTGDAGIRAEIVAFEDVEALRAAPIGSLDGKIVYVSHHMMRAQDGSGYGFAGPTRWNAPSLAAERGAAAIVIRSVGTANHRSPHTGITSWADGIAPIAAGALSNPDADNLERMVALGEPVTMHLTLTPRWLGNQESGNVIAEIPGTDPDAGIVLAACHLDSWDLSPGVLDDASGCGIITAAAHAILESGRLPRRTIRLFWAGAEEVGPLGGDAYYERYGAENHALVSESDFGADRVWRAEFALPESASDDADRVARLLAPLGIPRSPIPATGGADIRILVRNGAPVIDLQQDGTRYFDLHHTRNDTLDKVDPAQMRQNVAAWIVMLSVMANSESALSPAETRE